MAERIIEQRIRNRLLEWLEDAASGLEAETDLNELINQWYDWTGDKLIANRLSL